MVHPTVQDLRWQKVREWLLALLRFAVTLEPAERATVLALADEMDRLGFVAKKPEFSFFLRTSTDICHAVADCDRAGRKEILWRHVARIDEPRLRRAFAAVFDLESQEVEPARRDRRATLLRSVQSKMHR